jgi:long-chain acyl-CoA synthetase
MKPGQRVNWTSLPQMMLELARHRHDKPMMRHWRGGAWQRLSWGDFALAVASVAAGLRAAGIAPGDRVVLVSENRPEFVIADTALMAIGAVTVPTYTTNAVSDHAHILRDSGARAAIVSTAALAERVLQGAAQAAQGGGILDLLILMEGEAPAGAPRTLAGTRWPRPRPIRA